MLYNRNKHADCRNLRVGTCNCLAIKFQYLTNFPNLLTWLLTYVDRPTMHLNCFCKGKNLVNSAANVDYSSHVCIICGSLSPQQMRQTSGTHLKPKPNSKQTVAVLVYKKVTIKWSDHSLQVTEAGYVKVLVNMHLTLAGMLHHQLVCTWVSAFASALPDDNANGRNMSLDVTVGALPTNFCSALRIAWYNLR